MNPIALITGSAWRTAFCVAAALAAAQTVRIDGLWLVSGLKAELAEAIAAADNEAKAHRQTKESYDLAQREAARLEGARIVAVAARQQEITDDVHSGYARRLADARARFDDLAGRLRGGEGAGAGASGAPGGKPLPGIPAAAGGAAQAPGANGLPVAELSLPELSLPELSLAERWRATEQALQLDALITWALRQGAVLPNPALPAATSDQKGPIDGR